MVIKRAPGVLTADFPQAKVVFNTATRMPYILNGTASEIWDLCKKPRCAKGLARYLRDRYGVNAAEAKEDIDRLINELKERGLLKLR